jgi:hypothetical protein
MQIEEMRKLILKVGRYPRAAELLNKTTATTPFTAFGAERSNP